MEIFETTNRKLALALISAGCRLAGSEDGKTPPVINLYTPDVCRQRYRRGPNGTLVPFLPPQGVSPQTFERAVIELRDAKKPGILTWRIWKDSEFTVAMKAWDDCVKAMTEWNWKKDDAAREGKAFNEPPPIPQIDTATAMRAYWVQCLNEDSMDAHIWVVCPSLTTMKVATQTVPIAGVKDEDAARVSYSGKGTGPIWNLNLSDSDREKIGAPKRP